ncbi:MAG: ABC transporter permease subunit [Gemmataceae bacterium]
MNMTPASPVNLLSYRPWRGRLGGPWRGVLAIARLGITGLARRKLFWALYAFALLIFFSFFFGQYLLVWAEGQVGEETVRAGGFMTFTPSKIVKDLRDELKLNGSAKTFRNLFWYEGVILIVSLALAGAQLVGNDFRHRSLPFYLSKPMQGRHYVLGKCLAVSAVVNLITTLPALVLLLEYGLLTSWQYFWATRWLVYGILGYGLILSVVMSLVLVAVTSVVQKTVPLVLVWSGLFVFLPGVALSLSVLQENRWYRLLDIWDDAYVVGNRLLGESLPDRPPAWAAATVLVVLCLISVAWLRLRIRAVEVV